MSEYSAKSLREKMKAKARFLAGEKDQKTDSSDWSPAEPLNTDAKTGMRPISQRAYKKGGKVVGAPAKARADRKQRASGGAMEKDIGVGMANKNMKQANEKREGIKHIGGLKRGGKIHKDKGGATPTTMSGYDVSNYGESEASKKINQALKAKRSGSNIGEILYNDKPYVSGTFGETPKKRGGKVARAEGGGVYDKKALGAIDPSPKRGPAGHYKKGGKVKKAGGGSMLEKLVGKPKTGSDMSQVGKMGTANYTQEDKGALNRALKGDDALPAAGEAAERSGKYQNYKKGGMAKADGGRAKIPSTVLRTDKDGKPMTPSRYDIYNHRDGKIVGKATNIKSARKVVDRRDNNYGGYAHSAVPVYDNGTDDTEMKSGGRTAKAAGGSLMSALKGAAKKASKKGGKTDINIVINAGKSEPRHIDAGMKRPSLEMMPPPPPMGAGAPPPAMPPMGGLDAGPMVPPGLPIGRKAGGRITKVAKSYKDMEAGAAGGEGRLQKTDIAKLHKDAPARKAGGRISKVAKSYMDMTSGAASGEGRLQKTDIAKAKKGRGK